MARQAQQLHSDKTREEVTVQLEFYSLAASHTRDISAGIARSIQVANKYFIGGYVVTGVSAH
jgi:hypothetical protein